MSWLFLFFSRIFYYCLLVFIKSCLDRTHAGVPVKLVTSSGEWNRCVQDKVESQTFTSLDL